jgi:hypothetical protein
MVKCDNLEEEVVKNLLVLPRKWRENLKKTTEIHVSGQWMSCPTFKVGVCRIHLEQGSSTRGQLTGFQRPALMISSLDHN